MKPAYRPDICLLAIVLAVIYAIAGCGDADVTQASSQPPLTASNQAETAQVTLQITGMT